MENWTKVTKNNKILFQESLEEINLKGNKISEISASTFVDLPNIESVNLQNNFLKTVARNSLQLFQTAGKFPQLFNLVWNHLPYTPSYNVDI